MYIAVETHNHLPQFYLRESCTVDEKLTFRTLYLLGSNPGDAIVYPGGNAFYFDPQLSDSLEKAGAAYTNDMLEDLFWPWLKPDIRRAIETFKSRSGSKRKILTEKQKENISAAVHAFDKRRTHYLKFSNMDQGPLENMPPVLFKDLPGKCRDEIEQKFLKQERRLKAHELKSYVYTIFDLQRYFQGFLAKKMPHALDQNKVDAYFVKEICRLNKALFNKKSRLAPYMIRYAVMFFDHPYANTRLIDEMSQDFMYRHHFHHQRPPIKVGTAKACKIFNIDKKELKTLSKKKLTQKYRKLARAVHPDTGGSNEAFVELNDAYQALLGKIKR